jgi:putative membrane protein
MNAFGIYVATIFLTKISFQDDISSLVVAGFVLALVNAVVRPFVIIFALPAYVLTLGLFSIVVNGAMIYLVDLLYGPFEISGIGTTLLAGIIIGLVNYILTRLFDILTPEAKD